jgi:hypothetical protein
MHDKSVVKIFASFFYLCQFNGRRLFACLRPCLLDILSSKDVEIYGDLVFT